MSIQTTSLDVTNGLRTLDEIVAAALQAIAVHGRIGFNYLRISDDPEGREHGVVAQNQDTHGKAEEDRTPILRGFSDNDISASTLSKKPRPDYELMRKVVAKLPKNTVRIYPYSNSRLTRRPRELDDWIELHKETGVLIKTVVSGDDDLSTADGRFVARVKADADAAEAERTSERVTRRIQQFREAGISGPGGARPFGYERGGTAIREDEAEAIEEGAKILLQGGTTGDVLRAWTKAGIKPVRAKVWSRRTIIGIYRSPRIAGLLEWEGALRTSTNVPEILERARWEAVKECLAPRPDASRDQGWWNTKNLLAGMLRCGGCGHAMRSKGPHYGCVTERGGCGRTFRKKDWVDQLVIDAMDLHLESLPANGAANAEATAEVAHTASEIRRLEALITDTLAAVREGAVSSQDGFPLVATAREDINRLRKQEAQHVQEAAAKITPGTALELWQSDDLGLRRRALASEIQMVMIHPLGRDKGYGRHRPLPVDSVDIVWAS